MVTGWRCQGKRTDLGLKQAGKKAMAARAAATKCRKKI